MLEAISELNQITLRIYFRLPRSSEWVGEYARPPLTFVSWKFNSIPMAVFPHSGFSHQKRLLTFYRLTENTVHFFSLSFLR